MYDPHAPAFINADNAAPVPNFNAVYRQPGPKRSSEEIQRGLDAVFSAPATAKPDAVETAERRLFGTTVQLRNAEKMLRQCRRLGHDDTIALLAVTHAQEAVSMASDALIEVLDAMARRDAA